MTLDPTERLGAHFREKSGCDFLVWAPRAQRLDLHLLSPEDRSLPMRRRPNGYFHLHDDKTAPGALYLFRFENGEERADPASRFQPRGVHGPSEVIDPRFDWTDQSWRGIELREYVFYELHVGTFTPESTFDAISPRLAELKDVGITAIELMPVSQFPGSRNWGYDGVYPFAAQSTYGGPDALKRLVNASHRAGLAVVLDVVYNHLGPEGNYLSRFGPYFTDFYHTPWGQAINFDRRHSDDVRRYFVENALQWTEDFHFDALRLDAVHAITDTSAQPFLGELASTVHEEAERLHRKIHLFPESDLNDARIVASDPLCGYGLDAAWNDDFHHSVHTLLTNDRHGYYEDFGSTAQLARAFSEGFVYSGQYSEFRDRRHGNSSSSLPAEKFVVFAQNHDQVGNRRLGERLSQLVSFEALKLAAGLIMLSPFLPLIFMGEEYGETAPFQYFVSHGDPALIEAVRKGRREEFTCFDWQGDVPDPQGESTFLRSRIAWDSRASAPGKFLLAFYKELIRLRREDVVFSRRDKKDLEAVGRDAPKSLLLRRWNGSEERLAIFNFGNEPSSIRVPVPAADWQRLLDSADARWGGPGSGVPESFHSAGQMQFNLPASSCAVFKRPPEAP
ncbi:MAG: malto-oligosyltrehalose trehalohydrolase [Candidatus Acidiferrales bacterium]